MFRRGPYSLFDANYDDATPSLRDYTNADELDWESDVDADSLLPSFLPSAILRCLQESADAHEHDTHVAPSKTQTPSSDTDSDPDNEETSSRFELIFTSISELAPASAQSAAKDKASIEQELHTRLYEVLLSYPRLKGKIRQLVSECGFSQTQQTLPQSSHPSMFSNQYHARTDEIPSEVTRLIDDMRDFVREFGEKNQLGCRW